MTMNATTTPTRLEKMRGLPWSVTFSFTTSIFGQLSFFGSMWVVFLNYIGLNKTSIGLLLSFIYFSDMVAMFVVPAVAKHGTKRTFLFFWMARYGFVALLFTLPWIMARYGTQGALILITCVMITFCLARSIGLTALFPWQHEYIPADIRGKYTAVDNLFMNVGNILSVVVIGVVLGNTPQLEKFLALIAVGLCFGVFSVWAASKVPGGAPAAIDSESRGLSFSERLKPIFEDRGLLLYLLGASLILLTNGAIISFVPLYMQERIGLPAGMVVLLQTGTMVGGVTASMLWGWAADRFGSKPVVLSGMLLTALLPVFLLSIPPHNSASAVIALIVTLFQGMATMGWTIGSTRLLFVNVVPAEERNAYMAINNTWVGIVSGLSQLLGGVVLDLAHNLDGQFLFVKIDAYTVLFTAGIILPFLGSLLIRRIRAETAISPREMASIFVRGNPFMAVESMVRYQFAWDEETTVQTTERFGHAKSLLTVDELLAALADPRFNVRFEAVVAIAHLGRQDARLREALIGALQGTQPALSVSAAWAIGRLGDAEAIPALRESLNSRYRSVQDHAARALGTLDDRDSIPTLLERLETETDFGLRLSFASALAKLRCNDVLEPLLHMLAEEQDQNVRIELALGAARLIGQEHFFIRLLRQTHKESGTAIAGALSEIARRWEREKKTVLAKSLKSASGSWSSGYPAEGARHLHDVLATLLEDPSLRGGGDPVMDAVLVDCTRALAEPNSAHNNAACIEYVLLAILCLSKF